MSKKNSRLEALAAWSSRMLEKNITLQPLGGDAGFRRYFRLQEVPGVLAVDAPPATENTAQFLKVRALLHEHGVAVPQVLDVDLDAGFLLIEDFGDKLFGNTITAETASSQYAAAMLSLLGLQQIPAVSAGLPEYNEAKLQEELALFVRWFLNDLLGCAVTPGIEALLETTFAALVASAREQPSVVVHRDFHSRNLLAAEDGRLALIDFQDAVTGPFTYDLVSLLRDCYLRLPAEQVERWALTYGDMAMDAGIIPTTPKAQYLRWFDWMGLQRHIKVLGVFARLHLRDGKSAYLQDLPLVIQYVTEVAAKYPELQEFSGWFADTVMPLCQQQAWYVEPAEAVV